MKRLPHSHLPWQCLERHPLKGRFESRAHLPSRSWQCVLVQKDGPADYYRCRQRQAKTWTNATGTLPTSITGAVAWTPANGGTLLALTGEPTFGSSAYTGMGAYYSTDLWTTWPRSPGVPAGGLGFALAVDPGNPSKVYAATQLGLFASTDGGRTYHNTDLPTGECSGVTDVQSRPECAFANVVTDVVVSEGGGVG